jgi:hypothetical protein
VAITTALLVPAPPSPSLLLVYNIRKEQKDAILGSQSLYLPAPPPPPVVSAVRK